MFSPVQIQILPTMARQSSWNAPSGRSATVATESRAVKADEFAAELVRALADKNVAPRTTPAVNPVLSTGGAWWSHPAYAKAMAVA